MTPTILFDFDGTIADSRALFLNAFNQLADRHGYRRIEDDTLDYLRTLSITQRCKFLKVPVYKIPFLAAEFLGIYQQYSDDIALYDGIQQVLEKLHQDGFTLGIISSNEEAIIRAFLTRHQLTMIDEVYASRSLFGKHHVMRKYMKKFNLTASDILYVGDELRDIKACQRVHIPIIWVDWGYDLASLVVSSTPTYTAHEPSTIATIAKQHFANIKKGV